MVLQQLAQVVQSISRQTVASTSATNVGISSGTILSSFWRKAVRRPFFFDAFALKRFKSIQECKYSGLP